MALDDGGLGAADGAIVGHIMHHDGAGTDVHIVADLDVADDDSTGTDPDIVPDNRAAVTFITDRDELVNHTVLAHRSRTDHGAMTVLDIESSTKFLARNVKSYRHTPAHQELDYRTKVTNPV